MYRFEDFCLQNIEMKILQQNKFTKIERTIMDCNLQDLKLRISIVIGMSASRMAYVWTYFDL